MLTTGNQLRAARALVDMDQAVLAERARVDVESIAAMEKRGAERLTGGVKAVMAALEAAGVEFLNHGRPGVRLRSSARALDHPGPLHAQSNDEWPEADA